MNFHTRMPSIRALSARLAEMPDPGKTMTPIGGVASMWSFRLKPCDFWTRRKKRVGIGATFGGDKAGTDDTRLKAYAGARLREVTSDLDLIRRILGQQRLSMGQNYSETADTSRQARRALGKLDFTANK